MGKLLYKELKLTASPLSYCFIAFAAMTMIPGYPIPVGAFFICLGIFYTYQQARECDDIPYTVMLPVRKKDTVTAKYLFVLLIELVSFVLCALLTVIRMTALKNAVPYVTNPMMNANAAYLGYVLLVFAAFNGIFLAGFFKTAYKIGKPFVLFCVVAFVIIGIGEALHHVPGLESLNSTSGVSTPQAVILAVGITAILFCTGISYQVAVKNFEKIDL